MKNEQLPLCGEKIPQVLLPDCLSHSFKTGDRVHTCRLIIPSKPIWFKATIVCPVDNVADLYWGQIDGDNRRSRFFAHPIFQNHQAEAALRLHWIATIQPEHFGLDFGFAVQPRGTCG